MDTVVVNVVCLSIVLLSCKSGQTIFEDIHGERINICNESIQSHIKLVTPYCQRVGNIFLDHILVNVFVFVSLITGNVKYAVNEMNSSSS